MDTEFRNGERTTLICYLFSREKLDIGSYPNYASCTGGLDDQNKVELSEFKGTYLEQIATRVLSSYLTDDIV